MSRRRISVNGLRFGQMFGPGSATWGSPLSREQAEAKADQTIKATRPRWAWFSVFTIVAMLWVWFIASTIAIF
jgi:hypothetical protein